MPNLRNLRAKPQTAFPLKHFIILCAALSTRILFASSTLFSWDSVQFALALHHFDVSIHQPHPPGYFLYVTLGKLFRAFIMDDNSALVALSISFNALSALVLYVFLRKLVSCEIALFTTLYYLFSPLVWFNAEVAMSYMGEAFFTVCIGFFAYQFMKNKRYTNLILCTFFLGLSGGIRQNTLVFLMPLWLFVSIEGLKGIQKSIFYVVKQVMVQTFFLGVLVASWLLPMILLSGGFHAYARILNSHWIRVAMRTSFFRNGAESLLINAAQLCVFTFYAFTAGLLLHLCYFYFLLRNKKLGSEDAYFFAAWCVPCILFYLLVHINYPGYVFTFLPAFFLAFGKAAEWLKKVAAPRAAAALLTFLFIVNPIVFLATPLLPTAKSIATHDSNLKEFLKTIRDRFPPEKTTILSFDHLYYGFRHAMYYLPEYTSYEVYRYEAGYDGNRRRFLGGDEHRYKHFKEIKIPHPTTTVVLFADSSVGYPFVEQSLKKNKTLYALLQNRFVLKHKSLPDGFKIYWFEAK